ncbi:MAG: D-tagatose-bisphosphate aldolase, class II, non-catalytic subunit [Xanthobacteraceae bacterium]
MKAILDLVARHKTGERCGIFSVCSAHPLVIEAAFRHAQRRGTPFALIEATSNQVNQDGGYTRMMPEDFRHAVERIADHAGLSRDRILLGGDHLGPNSWQALTAEDAMQRSEVLIDKYVSAGFRKIHLDCSMSCAGDPKSLPGETIALRAARLCAVAERAHAQSGGEAPVYVIGTEVPVPGGAAEDLDTLAVTTPDAARATLETHRALFDKSGLADAWRRVIALVVQPGVEFDHRKVIAYAPDKARALSRIAESADTILFEAHSTDYQSRSALADLVRDHFAILKVGPALTFALREALWALDAIEREWIDQGSWSGLRNIALARMKAEPRHWAKYYHASGAALDFDLQYSLSDRIRYYWPDPEIMRAQSTLFRNLSEDPPPRALISQYLPVAHRALNKGSFKNNPAELVMAHVCAVLDDYHAATLPAKDHA